VKRLLHVLVLAFAMPLLAIAFIVWLHSLPQES
jgi:hypothetical protein